MLFNFTELDLNPGSSELLMESGRLGFIIEEACSVADGIEANFVDVFLLVAAFKSFDDVISGVFESVDDLNNPALLFKDFSDASFVGFKVFLEK